MGKDDLSGLAVHFAQRLCGRAAGDQVLVSAAVREGCADRASRSPSEGRPS